MSFFIKNVKSEINAQVLPWLLRKKFDPEDINVSALGNVSLFPELNLAFNRVKKNGNSATISTLHHMNGNKFTSSQQAKKKSIHLTDGNARVLMNLDSFSYFVITRNPYSRILSAFLNKMDKSNYIEKFGKYSLDPDGFYKFLRWVAETGLECDKHWDFQKKLILGPLEQFDAVLKFESFPNCFEKLLCDHGFQISPTSKEILTTTNQSTRTRANEKIKFYYSKHAIDLVSTIFNEDFEFLKYNKNFGTILDN